MTEWNVRSLIDRFSRPSCHVPDSDTSVVHRLCEVAKSFLNARYVSHVQQRSHDPLLVQYGSDCTPVMTRERHREHYRSLDVIRKPKQGKEWLIQRLFLRDGFGLTIALFTEPRCMIRKTAWAHLSAARDLAPTPCELGHEGPLVYHNCFDKAIHAALDRHLMELHMSVHRQISNGMSLGQARLLSLLTWHTASGCALHDTHGGYRRAMFEYMEDSQLMKDAWCCVEAIRNSMNIMARGILEWLPSVLCFREWDLPVESQRLLWEALGLHAGAIDAQMELQIRWDSGRLCINPAAENNCDAPQAIMTTLLELWRIKEWTESRWGTMGSTCRSAVVCSLTGMHSLIKDLRKKPYVSEYYISGFDKFTEPVAHMFVVGGIGSLVTDAVLQSLFDADRLPLVINAIDAEVSLELAWVALLPADVWAVLAAVVGVPVQGLRSEALCVGLASASYTMWRFAAVRQSPFSLMGEGKDAKLEVLKAGPEPVGHTSSKIWQLEHLGYPRETIVAAMEVAEQASWSFMVGEQGHAACSRLMRYHPDYGQNMMACRSTIMQIAPLLSDSPEQKLCAAALRRCSALSRKRPQNITGRHMYCRDLLLLAQKKKQLGGKYDVADLGCRVIRGHARLWNGTDVDKKRLYDEEAAEVRDHKRQALADDRAVARSSVEVARLRLEVANTFDGPARMSACKFSPSEVDQFTMLLNDRRLTGAQVASQRVLAQAGVIEPPTQFQDVLEGLGVPVEVDLVATLPWVKVVCHNRRSFRSALFRLKTTESDEIVRFLWAMQNPLVVGFVCCEELALVDRDLPPAELMGRADAWENEYQVLPFLFKYSDTAGHLAATAIVDVKLETVLLPGHRVGADGPWQPLVDVFAALRLEAAASSSRRLRTGGPPQMLIWSAIILGCWICSGILLKVLARVFVGQSCLQPMVKSRIMRRMAV